MLSYLWYAHLIWGFLVGRYARLAPPTPLFHGSTAGMGTPIYFQANVRAGSAATSSSFFFRVLLTVRRGGEGRVPCIMLLYQHNYIAIQLFR